MPAVTALNRKKKKTYQGQRFKAVVESNHVTVTVLRQNPYAERAGHNVRRAAGPDQSSPKEMKYKQKAPPSRNRLEGLRIESGSVELS